MTKTACMIGVSALVLILGGAAPSPPKAKSAGLTLDVILEEVDLARNTLTARPYLHVVPPSGSTGGVIYAGHLPPGAKAALYGRLPVMPEAGLQTKGLKPGSRITLRLSAIEGGALVVVGAEENSEPAHLGVDFIDAKAPGDGR